MAERRASNRERRKPELLGSFEPALQAERLTDDEKEAEEQQPRKRARHQRRPITDSEAEEEEEEATAPRSTRRGGGSTKRAARPQRKQQQAEAAGQPPQAQSLSRAEFLGALHACPTLMDMILQQDGLRTPTLLARDAANLAVALCASSKQIDSAWRTLAAQAAGTDGFAGTALEALEAAKAAVKGNPARSQRCTTTTAKQEYRLRDKDLAGLDYVVRDNPIFWPAAPTRLYRVLDCLAILHHKYGDLAGIQAAKAKAAERSQKVKATRRGNTDRRKQEMEAAMKAEGLNSWRYRKHEDVIGFIKHGRRKAAKVAAGLKKLEEEEAQARERRLKLAERLEQEGLAREVQWHSLTPAKRYIAGEGEETLASVVAAVRREKAACEARARRTAELRRRLQEEGLLAGDGSGWEATAEAMEYAFRGAGSYMSSGKGSIDGIVKAARAEQKARQQKMEETKQLVKEMNVRERQALAALKAAGIDWTGHCFSEVEELAEFVYRGEGRKEDLAPAAQAHLHRQEEMEERRAHVRQLLRDEGLGDTLDLSYDDAMPFEKYFTTGEGDDGSLLAAARAQIDLRDRQARREQEILELVEAVSERQDRVATLLHDNGLPSFYAMSLASISYYINTGDGSDAAALADAKRHHNAKPHARLLAEVMAAAEGGGDAAGNAAGGIGDAAAAAAADPMLW